MSLKSILIVTVATLSLFSATPIEQNGQLSVSGPNLINESGNPIQLRGMSTHGIQYFDGFYTQKSVQGLANGWGADIIRISSYVNEGSPNYLQKPELWKAKIDQLVEYATEAGIYAMIDWHMLGPGDPNVFLEEAKEFWTYMAQTHGGKSNVLFDICNEPNSHGEWNMDNKGNWIETPLGYDVDWPMIKGYADAIIPLIRANEPDDQPNVIIVGTSEWASRPDLVIGNELTYDNIMYSMHFYAADQGDATNRPGEPSNYMNYVSTALAAEIPMFVTEFGTQNAAGEGDNDFVSSQIWLDTLEKYKISWCNWNYSNDHRSGAVFKQKASLGSVESYASPSNLKEAGLWIMDKMKNPVDDFGQGTPPTVALIGGVQGVTTETVPIFTWSGNDPDGEIAEYYIRLDNGDLVTVPISIISVSPEEPLGVGEHSFSVQAIDTDGNLSAIDTWSFTVISKEESIPTVTIKTGAIQNTTEVSPVFSWSGTDRDGEIVAYKIGWDDAELVSVHSTVLTSRPTMPLSLGEHSFSVVAVDNDGQTSPVDTWSFTVIEKSSVEGNILVNGDFSEGSTGWNLGLNHEGYYATSAFGTTEAVISEIALGFDNYRWGVQLAQSDITLEMGKNYTLSFKAKASAPRMLSSSIIQGYSPYAEYANGPREFDLTTVYQEFSYSFKMESATDAQTMIAFDMGTETPTLYIDDVVLVETIPASEKGISQTAMSQLNSVTCHIGNAKLQIPVHANAKVNDIVVLDLRGRVILSQAVGNSFIDLSSRTLSQGIYLIQLHTDMGVISTKIMQ